MLALAPVETPALHPRGLPFHSPVVRLAAKKILFSEYDTADFFYIVKSGLIVEHRSMFDGGRQVLAILFPGDMVGISPCSQHETSAEAVCDSEVEAIPRSELSRRMREDDSVRALITSHFLSRLNGSQAHIMLLGRMTAIERVASFIYQLSNRCAHSGSSGCLVEIPLARADIADYLGLTMETVCRAFGTLKSRKLIAMPKSNLVKVHDREALCQVAYGRHGGEAYFFHS